MEDLIIFFSGTLAILLLTSFIKIVTTLSILRFGLGLEGVGFGVAVLGLSLALTYFVMSPQLGRDPQIRSVVTAVWQGDQAHWETVFKPFLIKHSDLDVRDRFAGIALKLAVAEEGHTQAVAFDQADSVLVASFLLTELRNAFQIGLLLILPFLVLDLAVTNILMCLGITQLSYQVVSLPLKLALFCAVDGWTLLADKLVSSYL